GRLGRPRPRDLSGNGGPKDFQGFSRRCVMRRGLFALSVVVAAVGPAFAKVEIRDVKPLHAPLGPERKSLDVLPGDELFLGYVVTGLGADEKGHVNVETTVTVSDPDGKQLLTETNPTRGVLALGGGTFPGLARVGIGRATKPGTYKVSVTVR